MHLECREQIPKICSAIMGRTEEEIISEVKILSEFAVNIFEWRADFYEQADQPDSVQNILSKMRRAAKNREIIFSLRSQMQGGRCGMDSESQHQVFQRVLHSGYADYIELEVHNFLPWKQEIIKQAKELGTKTIASVYDYSKTPPSPRIRELLEHCEKTGADIPKIAVMTHSRRDVLSLLQGILESEDAYGKKKRIVVAMGSAGGISRFAPSLFGSFLTFSSGISTSLQGQINPNDLRLILNQTEG